MSHSISASPVAAPSGPGTAPKAMIAPDRLIGVRSMEPRDGASGAGSDLPGSGDAFPALLDRIQATGSNSAKTSTPGGDPALPAAPAAITPDEELAEANGSGDVQPVSFGMAKTDPSGDVLRGTVVGVTPGVQSGKPLPNGGNGLPVAPPPSAAVGKAHVSASGLALDGSATEVGHKPAVQRSEHAPLPESLPVKTGQPVLSNDRAERSVSPVGKAPPDTIDPRAAPGDPMPLSRATLDPSRPYGAVPAARIGRWDAMAEKSASRAASHGRMDPVAQPTGLRGEYEIDFRPGLRSDLRNARFAPPTNDRGASTADPSAMPRAQGEALQPTGSTAHLPTAPGAPPLAANAPSPGAPAGPAMSDPAANAKLAPQIEAAIDHIVQARESGRSARSDMVLRHGEFGAVTMRIEANGSDLRATLAARDPAFVPAIQAALAERGVAASIDNPASALSRGSEQGQSGQSSNNAGGGNAGAGGDQRYGSSPGSGQGSPQPYREQQPTSGAEPSAHEKLPEHREKGVRGDDLFA